MRSFSFAQLTLFGAALLVAGGFNNRAHAEPQHGAAAIICTNLSSGASWEIKIDYERGTVDSIPARISDSEISWHDGVGRNYTLDRKSGNLTVILASATGGNFLYDRCKLENN